MQTGSQGKPCKIQAQIQLQTQAQIQTQIQIHTNTNTTHTYKCKYGSNYKRKQKRDGERSIPVSSLAQSSSASSLTRPLLDDPNTKSQVQIHTHTQIQLHTQIPHTNTKTTDKCKYATVFCFVTYTPIVR